MPENVRYLPTANVPSLRPEHNSRGEFLLNDIAVAISVVAFEYAGVSLITEGHLVRGGLVSATGLLTGGVHGLKRWAKASKEAERVNAASDALRESLQKINGI